ncbi:spore germination protein [Bacillus sp. N9]
MPGFVGAVQIISVSSAAVFHIGDVFLINPFSNSKTYAGAGSFITGEDINITNEVSSTNTYDNDAVDQPLLLNL